MQTSSSDGGVGSALRRVCAGLLLLDALLAVTHLLWPEYRWGQGRHSYFNFGNQLTLASWVTSMQLVVGGGLALTAFHRERRLAKAEPSATSWLWLPCALLALGMSFFELSHAHTRLHFLHYPQTDLFEWLVVFCSRALALALLGWFVLGRINRAAGFTRFGVGWLLCWGLGTLLTPGLLLVGNDWGALVAGLLYLVGGTLLVTALAGYAFGPEAQFRLSCAGPPLTAELPPRLLLFFGVGSTTASLIFLQVLLHRMLGIFGSYVGSHAALSVALLGLAAGGLLGFLGQRHSPVLCLRVAAALLPLGVLLALGAPVALRQWPLAAALLLTVPFTCGSVVLTLALVQSTTHVVYFIDLLGAAVGALLIGPSLTAVREEGSFLVLAGFACLVTVCFFTRSPKRSLRLGVPVLAGALAAILISLGVQNATVNGINLAYPAIRDSYPSCQVLFSRSSLVGRYDIVRREPDHVSLTAYENCRITDTVRNVTPRYYALDPRVPHTLIENPAILILGLSGDGITKTARHFSNDVVGVELNPVVANLQRGELVRLNGNSYSGIDVILDDARNYLHRASRTFDMITLLNTHQSRGSTSGRGPSPEYLDTYEAVGEYLDHLTDRGLVVVEEPVTWPRREAPLWRLLGTMRQVLVDRGATAPEQHFFVFQWKTHRNNYQQILMKKTPFTSREEASLAQWLETLNQQEELEARVGHRLGPIDCVTTPLHWPLQPLGTNCSRLLRGELQLTSLPSVDLRLTTDNRPFHFHVDPRRAASRLAYLQVLLLTALVLPLALPLLRAAGGTLRRSWVSVLTVSLTGLGYLLLEVVLMQRYQLFLGVPSVSFATVLGTLLVCSGLGSLFSGRVSPRGAQLAAAGTVALLIAHELLSPIVFHAAAAVALPVKVLLCLLLLGPLGFVLGVPFPFVMRQGKSTFDASSAALLFALNAASGALAVPLELNLAVLCGLRGVLVVVGLLYLAVALLLTWLDRPGARLPLKPVVVAALAALLLAPLLPSRLSLAARATAKSPRVYALRYGRSTRRESQVLAGGDQRKRVSFAWYCWLVKAGNRTLLVDTGFNDPWMADRWGLRDYVRPTQRLRQLGVSPAEVTDVILTHAHWDHAGDVAPYRNAKVWLQQREYNHLRQTVNEMRPVAEGMHWHDLRALQKIETEGRLQLVDGNAELTPTVSLAWGGGHTPGSQYVLVQTDLGTVVLASDLCNFYVNHQWHTPVAGAHDAGEDLRAMRTMTNLAASPFYVIPGHDPRVRRWFPPLTNDLVELTPLKR